MSSLLRDSSVVERRIHNPEAWVQFPLPLPITETTMAKITTFTVKIAWWVHPYLYGVAAVAWLTGREPDVDKVWRRVERGVSLVRDSGPKA